MTTKAHVEQDWMRDMIRVAVRQESPGAVQALLFAATGVRLIEPDAGYTVPQEDEWLDLPEDAARAIYEALADHFGSPSNDTRALRRDYDAERARVDKFIAHLTGGQR